MCDRSPTQRSQWKWKCIITRSLVSNFILITPGMVVLWLFHRSFEREGWSPLIMLIEIADFDMIRLLKPYPLLFICVWIQVLFFHSLTFWITWNTRLLFPCQPHKYAIMVFLLSSLLGWLERRSRLSRSSNVGLMVLTCMGHRWSPEQPWLGPFIKALWRQRWSG